MNSLKMIRTVSMLVCVALVGIAHASAPSAPLTVCTDKNGSSNTAMCMTVTGNVNTEVGDAVGIQGWEEQRTNSTWVPVAASISIKQVSPGATLASCSSSCDTSYQFKTPGTYEIYSYNSLAGQSPHVTIPVLKRVPRMTESSTTTVATVGQSIRINYTINLYSPDSSGLILYKVTRPNGTTEVFDVEHMTNAYAGQTVTLAIPKDFTFTGTWGQPGTYGFTLSYQGDVLNINSDQGGLVVTVGPFSTTTTLTATSDTTLTAQPVTLTATVTGTNPGNTVPTGSVSFYDGTTLLGSATLSAAGVATLTTTQISSTGGHLLTAQYGGDATNQPSTSAVIGHQANFNPAILIPIISELLQ